MKPTEHYPQLLQTRGISLQVFGVRGVALRREDAILALQFPSDATVPVLGGDVYLQGDNGLELAFAEEYIKRFAEHRGVTPVFALVTDDPVG